jgi:hypothetical protein
MCKLSKEQELNQSSDPFSLSGLGKRALEEFFAQSSAPSGPSRDSTIDSPVSEPVSQPKVSLSDEISSLIKMNKQKSNLL